MEDNQVTEEKCDGALYAGLVVAALVLAVTGFILVRMLKEEDTPKVEALRITEH